MWLFVNAVEVSGSRDAEETIFLLILGVGAGKRCVIEVEDRILSLVWIL